MIRHMGRALRRFGRWARRVACCCGCKCPAGLPSTVLVSYDHTNLATDGSSIPCTNEHMAITIEAGVSGAAPTPENCTYRNLVAYFAGVSSCGLPFNFYDISMVGPSPASVPLECGWTLNFGRSAFNTSTFARRTDPRGAYPDCNGSGHFFTNIVVS